MRRRSCSDHREQNVYDHLLNIDVFLCLSCESHIIHWPVWHAPSAEDRTVSITTEGIALQTTTEPCPCTVGGCLMWTPVCVKLFVKKDTETSSSPVEELHLGFYFDTQTT